MAIFSFAALSIDLATVYSQRSQIQEATDAAAMAAIREWASGKSASDAEATAWAFAKANGIKDGEMEAFEVGTWDNDTRTFTATDKLEPLDTPAVRTVSRRTVVTPFTKVIGMSQMRPRVESTTVAAAASAADGILPLGFIDTENVIPTKTSEACVAFELKYSTLDDATGKGGEDDDDDDKDKEDKSSKSDKRSSKDTDKDETKSKSSKEKKDKKDGDSGEDDDDDDKSLLVSLSLGTSEDSSYEAQIEDGYSEKMRAGESVSLQTANLTDATISALKDRISYAPEFTCPKDSFVNLSENKPLVILPLIDQPSSGDKTATINSFVVVSIDAIDTKSKTISMRLVRMFSGQEIDLSAAPQTGLLNGVALTIESPGD